MMPFCHGATRGVAVAPASTGDADFLTASHGRHGRLSAIWRLSGDCRQHTISLGHVLQQACDAQNRLDAVVRESAVEGALRPVQSAVLELMKTRSAREKGIAHDGESRFSQQETKRAG